MASNKNIYRKMRRNNTEKRSAVNVEKMIRGAKAFMRKYREGGKHGPRANTDEVLKRIDRNVAAQLEAFKKEIGLNE